MTRAFIAAGTRLRHAVEGSTDRGQSTLEYVGMIALAALLVAVVVSAFAHGSSLARTVSEALSKISGIVG
ncbi:hypothetical protein [Leekyejoonella antrihumi]|uniref:DUF4244 domain-containing protein n=1 Tax=Leekyejoonella antrihumi TaxID=1660198 RepID=A0A563E0B2_9MICO|nr:hypothetical protein [Leekyejoonella antrihumi]TWP35957.1 hypothetical protein FGL98_12045 [Leekyejoonella antrihumi]